MIVSKFVDRLLKLEYEIYGLPKPELTLFLDMPVAFSERPDYQKEELARIQQTKESSKGLRRNEVDVPPWEV